MPTLTVTFEVPREVALYRLAQLGFTVVDVPTHTPFSAPAAVTVDKPTRRSRKVAKTAEPRQFHAPLIVRQRLPSNVFGPENVREIDGISVEKEMARVMRRFCSSLSTSGASADRRYPDTINGEWRKTTADYVRSFDRLNSLRACEYQQLTNADDGLFLGVDSDE